MEPIVDVSNVSFSYGDHPVLEDVSLSLTAGDFLGLVGPNGSGKTTLLKLILGVLSPDSGDVRLFGQPASSFDDGKRIAYVSQHATKADSSIPVTVCEVVRMGRYPHVGLNGLTKDDEARIDDALETVGIADLASRRIGRISGGQKQRAYIARAIAADADLLALDEPTVGVDAESREQFYHVVNELNDAGVTVILIEHDIGVVANHVNRLACINRQLKHYGDPQSFLESDAVLELFGTQPIPTVAQS